MDKDIQKVYGENQTELHPLFFFFTWKLLIFINISPLCHTDSFLSICLNALPITIFIFDMSVCLWLQHTVPSWNIPLKKMEQFQISWFQHFLSWYYLCPLHITGTLGKKRFISKITTAVTATVMRPTTSNDICDKPI